MKHDEKAELDKYLCRFGKCMRDACFVVYFNGPQTTSVYCQKHTPKPDNSTLIRCLCGPLDLSPQPA
jgi:hypothetical protein